MVRDALKIAQKAVVLVLRPRNVMNSCVGRGARLYRTFGMTRFCQSTSRMVGTMDVISFWPRLLRSQYHSLYSRFAGPCPLPQMATVICATAPARQHRQQGTCSKSSSGHTTCNDVYLHHTLTDEATVWRRGLV